MLAPYMLSSCVRQSVRLSHSSTVPNRLIVGSRQQRRTIAQGFWFSDVEDLGEIPTGSSPTRAPNRGGVGYNLDVSQKLCKIGI